MPNGALTTRVALLLQKEFEKQGFIVIHDHRIENLVSTDIPGKLRTWFGSSPKRETLLADLDIAIISAEDEVITLVEIEETTDKPKVILGDIFAILLGSGITYKGNKEYKIGEWTTLIVMSHDKTKSHFKRTAFICDQIKNLKEKIETPNKTIGKIIVENFANEEGLEEMLKQHVEKAIAHYEIGISSASKI